MSNLGQSSPTAVKVGDTIRFTTKNIHDLTVYTGKVVSICDAVTARVYGDVAATQQAMWATDPTIDDTDNLRYLIVECYDGVRRPYGFEADGTNSWFTNNQVEIISDGSDFRIKIYSVTSADAELAIRILREQGYTCKIEV